ncbi:transcriptional regulator GlxA family with amidase domain [Chitinophaga terrae (ex Kim and Jung 2007)]|uniref:GlxA family transcriptional regulator n=1 Tax=Chitinophaga terrae (ex Kim and Jung 2007) TaxID=408074 RepID=UPI0027824231|nr:helix-turn-helix domain-containing protein [Chitinophaga terrae (ex Kim and Jung 2007)]MDQ0106719.1 transcriptional regulator GlxA family with amidase domain [Chitinophaga terrae (ex Kim and Jung 2007)]
MIHISILVPLGRCSVANIESSYQILSEVNSVLEAQQRNSLFKIELVGNGDQIPQRDDQFMVAPDRHLDEVPHTDLILIPSLQGEIPHMLDANRELVPWIRKHYHQGASVASLCLGAFLLADTGLLDGKQCTTHWKWAETFRKMYPGIELRDEKIITEDGRIFTSGGAFSYLNLLIYLVEKYAGRDMAVAIAKAYAIEMNRPGQSAFMIFEGQKAHKDEKIKMAQEFIEKGFREKISVGQLADMTAISRRSFERRFKKNTGNTVVEYIQRIKIEAAKRDFESSDKTINEVISDVGYIDSKAFRTIFKRITGLTPMEYRNKFNRQVLEEEVE